MAYTGSTELISGIVQKNGGSFPLVDASAVRVTDDTMLDATLSQMEYVAQAAITALNGKEDAGKITIGGTDYTASKHTVTIVTDGVTTTFDMVGVS